MARKSSNAQLGGALTFLGALIYLYVYYAWYSSGYAPSLWLSTASFLAPFVIGAALFSAVSLFFMGLGKVAGMMPPDPKTMVRVSWQFVMWAAITFVILTGGTAWYYWSILALLLTFIGAMLSNK